MRADQRRFVLQACDTAWWPSGVDAYSLSGLSLRAARHVYNHLVACEPESIYPGTKNEDWEHDLGRLT